MGMNRLWVSLPLTLPSPRTLRYGERRRELCPPHTFGTHRISSSPRRSHCCERGEGRVRGSDAHKHIIPSIYPTILRNGCVSVGASGARPSSFLHRGAKRGERRSPLQDSASFTISETIIRKLIPAPSHGLILLAALPPRDRNARWWIGSRERRGCRT